MTDDISKVVAEMRELSATSDYCAYGTIATSAVRSWADCLEFATARAEVGEGLDSECQMHREMHFRIDEIVLGTGVFEVIHDGGQREAWENTVAAVATLARQLAEAKAEIAALSDDVAEYQRNIDAESFALTKAESALAAANAEIERLKYLAAELDAKLGKPRCRGVNADGNPRCLELAEATRRLDEAGFLVADWRDQAKRLRNEVPNLRDGTDKRFVAACDADTAADELEVALTKEPTK